MSIQNPRTYLELCQRASIECGVAGTLTTTVNQTGSLGRIVNWVADSWSDVQCDTDEWEWMRSSNILGAGISFATVLGQKSYPLGTGAGTVGVAVDDFGKWDRTTFRVQTTSAGVGSQTYLADIPFDAWRDGYMFGAQQDARSRPVVSAIGPDQSINLGPPPIAGLTVTGDYWVAPSEMVADSDVPTGLPRRFTMLIVYFAMQKYAGYEAAPEVMDRGVREANGMYAQLQAVRAPIISWSGALA